MNQNDLTYFETDPWWMLTGVNSPFNKDERMIIDVFKPDIIKSDSIKSATKPAAGKSSAPGRGVGFSKWTERYLNIPFDALQKRNSIFTQAHVIGIYKQLVMGGCIKSRIFDTLKIYFTPEFFEVYNVTAWCKSEFINRLNAFIDRNNLRNYGITDNQIFHINENIKRDKSTGLNNYATWVQICGQSFCDEFKLKYNKRSSQSTIAKTLLKIL